MSKVYFVLGSTDGQRCFKRIEEFRSSGFQIKVFGFDRGLGIPIANKEKCEIIGSFPNSMPYTKRITLIYKSLHGLYHKYKNDKSIIWYYFGDFIAFTSFFFNPNKKYIYEESDIVSLNSRILNSLKKCLCKYIIRKSLLTVFTSEGFIFYHYGTIERKPANVIVKPNKVNKKILEIPEVQKRGIDIHHIHWGFVGCIRFKSIYNVAQIIGKEYPQHEFHFYGVFDNSIHEQEFNNLKKYSNIYFHGSFRNPDDLPEIYSNIDILISSYGKIGFNVMYAEPNKLYEAIYFKTPIIVNIGTFLGEKVEKMGIGYTIDANNPDAVRSLINNIGESLKLKYKSLQGISQNEALEECETMIHKLKSALADIH